MQYICFDIEAYKDIDNKSDIFIISKHKDNTQIFRNPKSFLIYVNKVGEETNEPVILVGYNCINFDFTLLAIWIGYIRNYGEDKALDLALEFVRYWIDDGKSVHNALIENSEGVDKEEDNNEVDIDELVQISKAKKSRMPVSLYRKVEGLVYNPNYPNINVDEITSFLKHLHPEISKQPRLMFKIPKEYSHNQIYVLDLYASIYKSGSLKIRSLIEGCEAFKSGGIIDFEHDSLKVRTEVEEYACKDINATMELLHVNNVGLKYAETCVKFYEHHNLQSKLCILDSTDGVKLVDNVTDYVAELEPQIDFESLPITYSKFENDLINITGVNFLQTEYKFYKDYDGLKFLKFTLPLTVENGEYNRGGLHYAVDYTIFENDDEGVVCEFDFSSLYPNVMTSHLCPVTSDKGKQLIKDNILKREELKKQGDKTQEVYKLMNNTLYGLLPELTKRKFRSYKNDGYQSYSLKAFNYVLNYVTRIAQVSLIKLIDFLIQRFKTVDIGNINTDSVMCKIYKSSKEEITTALNEFNRDFKLHSSTVNLTFFDKLVIYNTNSYMKFNADKISYMGSKFTSVKVNGTKKSEKTGKEAVDYPLFVNSYDIFSKLLQSYKAKGINLTDVRVLKDIRPLLKDILIDVKPLFFYKMDKEVSTTIKGSLLDGVVVENNALTSRNFRYSDQHQDPLDFCERFYSAVFENFFKINYRVLINDMKEGKCLTTETYGKDYVRSKLVINAEGEDRVMYLNSLIHKSVRYAKITPYIEKNENTKRLKFDKLKLKTPLDLLDLVKSDAGTILTETQLEGLNFKALLPYCYDFDFKCKETCSYKITEALEKREELLEDLKNLYAKYPYAILLIEWNTHVGNKELEIKLKGKLSRNGIHIIVLGCLDTRDALHNILNKYKTYLDPRANTESISLYENNYNYRVRQRLGSVEVLTQYIASLFNYLYPTVDSTDQLPSVELINNAQIRGGKLLHKISNVEEKYINYENDPFIANGVELTDNQRTFIDITKKHIYMEFGHGRGGWFKTLGRIKLNLRFLMEKLDFDDNDPLVKEFIFDMLVKVSLNCPVSGKHSLDFSIDDTLKVCNGQVYDTYGNKLRGLTTKGNCEYFNTFLTMYKIANDNQILTETKDSVDLIKLLLNVYTTHKDEDLTKVDGMKKDKVNDIPVSRTQCPIDFYEASTGVGKTYNIVNYICNHYEDDPDGALFIVFTTSKIEIKQLEDRLVERNKDILIGKYTNDVKELFDINHRYDVILITSAYLSTSNQLPVKIREFLVTDRKELKRPIMVMIDEFDNALSTASEYIPLFIPYRPVTTSFNNPNLNVDDLLKQVEAIPNITDELRQFMSLTITNTSVSTDLHKYKGYEHIKSRGDCATGCICNSNLPIVYSTCVGYGTYNKSYIKDKITLPYKLKDDQKDYVINNGSFFKEGLNFITIEECLGEVLIDTAPFSIYKPSEKFFDYIDKENEHLKSIFYSDCRIVKLTRCLFESTEQYLSNSEYPCGSYFLTFTKTSGIENIINNVASRVVMFTATKDYKTKNFLKSYQVKNYRIETDKTKLHKVNLNVYFDVDMEKSLKEIKDTQLASNDIYLLNNIVMLNRAGKVDQLNSLDVGNEGDINIKAGKGTDLQCALNTIDYNGCDYLQIPDKDVNVVTSTKNSLARGIVIQASNIKIEFGNTGRIYDAFFIEHLLLNKDELEDESIQSIIECYHDYNGNVASAICIQAMGRVLRGFITANQEINLTGRDIDLYIKKKDMLYLFKVLSNLITRCHTDSLNITDMNTGKSLNYLIPLI